MLPFGIKFILFEFPTITMGNTNLNLQAFPLSAHKWEQMPLDGHFYDRESNTEAVAFGKQQITKEEFDIYKMRAEHKELLVQVVAILGPPDRGLTSFSCNKEQLFKVLVEKIAYRLPDLGSLDYETGLYILRQSFAAMKVLYHKYGAFNITEEMIGFNLEGKCKFWLNSDYSSCLKQPDSIDYENPEDPYSPEKRMNYEQKMTSQIFNLIEGRMFPNLSSKQRSEYLKKKRDVLGKDGNTDEEDEFEYCFSGGAIFVNFLCNLRKLDCRLFQVELPQSNYPELKTALMRYSSDAETSSTKNNNPNKLSLKQSNLCRNPRIQSSSQANTKNYKSLKMSTADKYASNTESAATVATQETPKKKSLNNMARWKNEVVMSMTPPNNVVRVSTGLKLKFRADTNIFN